MSEMSPPIETIDTSPSAHRRVGASEDLSSTEVTQIVPSAMLVST